MFVRTIRVLIGTALLVQAVGLVAAAHTIWLMRHSEAFWMYHDGDWQRYAWGTAIVGVTVAILGRWRPWAGLTVLAAGALFTLAPLAANLLLPYSEGLPEISYPAQRTVVELFVLAMLIFLSELGVGAGFIALMHLFGSYDPESPVVGAEQPQRAMEVIEVVAADEGLPILDDYSRRL